MFSGAGGLTEGFLQSGYDCIAHIEMDKNAVETLETRLFYHVLKDNYLKDEYYSYINEEISKEQLYENNEDILCDVKKSIFNFEINNDSEKYLINQIKKLTNNKPVEGIIGGPPCQAYSLMGRARLPNSMCNDSRNFLYKHYINFLKAFNPNFFVFENVPGMLSAKNKNVFRDFLNRIRKLKYNIDVNIENSMYYNVLQSRKRLIIIGHKIQGYEFFDDVYIDKEFHSGYLVNDVLNDLPKLHANEGTLSVQDYTNKPSKYLEKFNIRNKQDKIMGHKARYHNNRDLEIYSRAIKLWNENHSRLKYDDLPDYLKTHSNRTSFVDRYKVVSGDLPYCHTIMAHLSKDGHYFIHPDIMQLRSITPREAARLQSFPDNYKFEGAMTNQFKQIGNAVPPLMAKGIANDIKRVLSN